MAVTKSELEEVQQLTHRLREIVDLGEGELAERKQNFDALNARIDSIETKAARPQLFTGATDAQGEPIDFETKAQQKARKSAMRALIAADFNLRNMRAEDRANLVPELTKDGSVNSKALDLKALNLTDDTLGGFFVLPEIVQDEIIRNVVLTSPIRALARVMTTSSNSLKIPVLTSPTAAGWTSETGTRSVSANPQFGMKDIPTHEMYALMLFSRQLLEDSFFDMEREMSFEFSQQFAKLEGAAFVNGNGVGQPLGILNDPNMTSFQTAGSGVLAADDLISAYHNYPTFAYYAPRSTWLANLKTIGVIRKLKDLQNRYLWEPGLPNGNPATILDRPYVVVPDMPDIASGAIALAFGDWQSAYRVVDRTQIAVQRLSELYATSAQIGVLAYKRVGAQTVLSEAAHGVKVQ